MHLCRESQFHCLKIPLPSICRANAASAVSKGANNSRRRATGLLFPWQTFLLRAVARSKKNEAELWKKNQIQSSTSSATRFWKPGVSELNVGRWSNTPCGSIFIAHTSTKPILLFEGGTNWLFHFYYLGKYVNHLTLKIITTLSFGQKLLSMLTQYAMNIAMPFLQRRGQSYETARSICHRVYRLL